jgi:hypothetical protein
MINAISAISFVIGLYVAFGIWVIVTTATGGLLLFPLVAITIVWATITIRCNNAFTLVKKEEDE